MGREVVEARSCCLVWHLLSSTTFIGPLYDYNTSFLNLLTLMLPRVATVKVTPRVAMQKVFILLVLSALS